MEEIDELIKRYNLEQDEEHIIIPFRDKNGKKKRCFLLKRRFIRIMYSEENVVDYPIEDAIEATVRFPDLQLSDALSLLYKELNIQPKGISSNSIDF